MEWRCTTTGSSGDFLFLLSVICLFTSGLYFAKIRRMFSSIGFAGSSKKNVQHVTLLISSSIKCSAFKYSVFYVLFPFGLHVFFFFFIRWFRMILTDIRHHSIVLTEVMHNLEVILICFVFSNICILFIYYDLFFLIIYKMEVIMISFHHMYTTKVFCRNRMCMCFFLIRIFILIFL